MADLTLVVLAAGLSSRYGTGLKQVDGVGPSGEFLLDYAVFDAWRAGFTRVVFVARPEIEDALRARMEGWPDGLSGDVVFQALEDVPPGFTVPPNRHKPWGTGHATLAAAPVVASPFAVINADDFYGPGAYREVAAFLRRACAQRRLPAAMVGYRLGDTLSAHAGVSRAICEPHPTGGVARVTELFGITARDGAIAGLDGDEATVALEADDLASMNFWGFVPAIFGLLEDRFARFLEARGADAGAEFLLSTAVNELIAADRIVLEVLPTEEIWCGMTSRADREAVAARMAELVAAGVYPERLPGV